MALLKSIELDNGVTVKYHRIVSVNIVANQQNIIEVASYTSREKREEEIQALANGEDMNVYIETQFFNTDYAQGMTCRTAYDWLKANVPAFEGAEDDGETQTDDVTGDEFLSMVQEVL